MTKPNRETATAIKDRENKWTRACGKLLIGKTVGSVFYMDDQDAENMGFSCRPLVIQFTDGTQIFAQADDEGNDGGAYCTSDEALPIIPVLS